ncbi:hypothetical protein [Shewanella violacea]|uniref:Uncharacterized protein n=1 Tax=Shewanella violacea (strain JCM 10179 / CIP 106290 / LMG 19151 / DSS12) TaxID=637905 RepID=D4ZHK9_SHEVD|nr:hypothetical protein [Shewanella violacea]BAJ01158.1 hypothetical protein SVI_1187 [Shewanella violacea DSS12]
MTLFRVTGLALIAIFLNGCQEDVTFQLDTVTEVKAKPATSVKEVAGMNGVEKKDSACYLRVYAVNHLDYGIKVGPKIKVNIHGVEYTFQIDSWGDDWEYLVAGQEGEKGEEYRQKLCFKEIEETPVNCPDFAQAIRNQDYQLELNRCEKIDQSPASCNMVIGVAQGGLHFRAIAANELDTSQLAG